MKNIEIAGVFRDYAVILEIKGENVFRIRAYEKAAQVLEGLPGDIERYASEGTLTEIPGIGKDLSGKIKEFLKTGKIESFEELKKSLPEGLPELLSIPSVGPKTVKLLYERAGVKNINDLEKAIREHKLDGIAGIKEKTIENIAGGISVVKRVKERMPLPVAIQLADEFISPLKELPEVKNIVCAGSLRRHKETIRDIDILITSENPRRVMDTFVVLPGVKEIQSHGETKSSVRTAGGIQIDCRVVEEKSFGAALLYFTGSKNFNINIRQRAVKQGLKINEYGVFKGDKFVAGHTEKDIFKLLKLEYVEPELREDNGEIELAQKFSLPRLVESGDIQGDLHAHSTWSDGSNSIREMADAAEKKGYSYIAITDHSQSLRVARGLSISDLAVKKKEIDKINKNSKGFTVLYGTEADIGMNGDIDYPDEILRGFDIVVGAVHSGFRQSREQMTKRLIRACKNKFVNFIAHPTGRLWGSRDAYEFDFDEVLKAARDTNTHLEINSFPDRLDLNDLNCRKAKEAGVKLVINTDAHSTAHLGMISYGLMVARRGWLEAHDVINTFPLKELRKIIIKN